MNPEIREDRLLHATQFGDTSAADHKILNEETSQYCNIGTQLFGLSMGSRVSMQKQDRTRNFEYIAVIHISQGQAWSYFQWQFNGIHESLRRLRVESQQVDPTPIRNKWIRRKGGSEE